MGARPEGGGDGPGSADPMKGGGDPTHSDTESERVPAPDTEKAGPRHESAGA